MLPDLAAYRLTLFAQEGSIESSGNILVQHVLAAIVFSIIGIVIFALSMWIIERITPFSLRKEIEEDQNVALGIVVASLIVGISIIIAAAILG